MDWEDLSLRLFEPTLPGSSEVLKCIQPVFGALIALPAGRSLSVLRLWGKLQRLTGAMYPLRDIDRIVNIHTTKGAQVVERLRRFFLFAICAYAPNHPRMSATKLADVPDMEIIHAQSKTSGARPSHMLVADHCSRELILTIRGSAEVADWLINLNCRTSSEGTHPGMMKSAQALRGLLFDIVETFMATHEGYEFHLCGHSLGGGIASLLAISLRAELGPNLKYPIKAWSYGAPCIVTPEDNPKYDDMITSVIFGKDVVSRFSFRTMDRVLYTLNILVEDSLASACGRKAKPSGPPKGVPPAEQSYWSYCPTVNFHLNGLDLLHPRTCPIPGPKASETTSRFAPSFDRIWELSREATRQREDYMIRSSPAVAGSSLLFWRRMADTFHAFLTGKKAPEEKECGLAGWNTPFHRAPEETGREMLSARTNLVLDDNFMLDLERFLSPKSDSMSTTGSTPHRSGTVSPQLTTSCENVRLEVGAPRIDPVLRRSHDEITRLADLENNVDLMPAGRMISVVPQMHLLETGIDIPHSLLINGCLFMECKTMQERQQLRVPVLSLESVTDHLIDKYAQALCPELLKGLDKEQGNG